MDRLIDAVLETEEEIAEFFPKLMFEDDERSNSFMPELRFLSKVDRAVVRIGDNCAECQANNDPAKVPVHPGCDCEVVTTGIESGIDQVTWKPVEHWIRENGKLRFIQGNLGPPKPAPALETLQFESSTVSALDIGDARFSDVQAWLDKIDPLLRSGDYIVSIVSVVDDGQDVVEAIEAVQEVAETVQTAETASELLHKRVLLSLVKVVT